MAKEQRRENTRSEKSYLAVVVAGVREIGRALGSTALHVRATVDARDRSERARSEGAPTRSRSTAARSFSGERARRREGPRWRRLLLLRRHGRSRRCRHFAYQAEEGRGRGENELGFRGIAARGVLIGRKRRSAVGWRPTAEISVVPQATYGPGAFWLSRPRPRLRPGRGGRERAARFERAAVGRGYARWAKWPFCTVNSRKMKSI